MKTIVENKVPLFGLGYPVTEHFTGDAWNIMPPQKSIARTAYRRCVGLPDCWYFGKVGIKGDF